MGKMKQIAFVFSRIRLNGKQMEISVRLELLLMFLIPVHRVCRSSEAHLACSSY